MSTIRLKNKLVNLDKIHFVRIEDKCQLVISFGTDFIRFTGSPTEIQDLFNKIENLCNEKLSSTNRR